MKKDSYIVNNLAVIFIKHRRGKVDCSAAQTSSDRKDTREKGNNDSSWDKIPVVNNLRHMLILPVAGELYSPIPLETRDQNHLIKDNNTVDNRRKIKDGFNYPKLAVKTQNDDRA